MAQGLAPSRERAQAFLVAGRVFVGEVRIEKPGTLLPLDTLLVVRGNDVAYVSRGGDKLAGALAAFAPWGLDPRGAVAVDVGASTGGFTDCLLRAGATRVYAVDVGYGQLHERLRGDSRVVVRERTNARFLEGSSFPEAITLVTVDASFIGFAQLAPALARIASPDAALCALIKPQFEAGRDVVQRGKGVVRRDEDRHAAIASAERSLTEAGFRIVAGHDCVLAGPKGNREYFVLGRKEDVRG